MKQSRQAFAARRGLFHWFFPESMTDTHHSRLRWSYLSTLSTTIMQLIASATITRFLQPSDYGLAAIAMLCYSMTGYFTQMGTARAIVQKPGLTNGNIRAAFCLAVVTGVGGFLILAALSPFLGRYFREPRLPPILVAFGLNLVFQSVSAVAGGLLRREFRIRDLAICDFLGYLLSTFGVGLPMAIKGYGVWALVGSNVSQPFLVVLFYFLARPHSVLPTFKREDYQHITGFSGKASITTSIEALGGSLDMIIMGRLLAPAPLGMYNRSLTLSTQPGYNLSMGLTRVFHPTIARAAERGLAECHDILRSSERQLMSLIFPFCAAIGLGAHTIIPVIFGAQWISAVPVFQALCLVAALDASFHLPAIQLEVLSLFRYKFILQSVFALLFGAGILLAAPRGGILAVGFVYAGLQAVRTFGLHVLSARSLKVPAVSLFVPWIPGLLCAAILSGILWAVQFHTAFYLWLEPIFRLLLLMAISLITLIVVYRTLYRRTVYDAWMGLFRRAPRDPVSESIAEQAEVDLLDGRHTQQEDLLGQRSPLDPAAE